MKNNDIFAKGKVAAALHAETVSISKNGFEVVSAELSHVNKSITAQNTCDP